LKAKIKLKPFSLVKLPNNIYNNYPMKKIILFIAVALFAVGANAQHQRQVGPREPVAFAKEKIANMAKYVEITKEDSTKLQKIFVDYQKEATASQDKVKRSEIVKALQGKLEAAMGTEKYKIYREKSAADPANQRGMHR
jgi:Skp family chaperone for outer membrane proteins